MRSRAPDPARGRRNTHTPRFPLRGLPALMRAASLLLLGLLIACGERSANRPPAVVQARESTAAVPPAPAADRRTYTQEAAALTGAIDAALQALSRQPDNAQMALETVDLVLERARLVGNYDDYRLARSLLDRVAKLPDTAPLRCLPQARLHYTLHQLVLADAALSTCAGAVDPVEAGGLRADIALFSGRYPEAGDRYRALVNQVGDSTHYLRLALLKSRTGAPGEAAALLEAAERRYHGVSASTRAWFKLQRGLLAWDRGRLDEALALYHLAADELPGWWRIDEQIAEVRRLSGDTAGAQALFEDIIARSGQPEHMDELARLLREGRTPEAATPWIRRAQTLYRERLQAFPEAGLGHAVEHFLQFGTPAEALDLARRNAALRPFGEAQIALAAALFRAGQAGEAARVIGLVQASGWNTAQLHAVAAQIHAGLGQHTQADAQRVQALAMNPHAMRLFLVVPPVQPDLVSLS